MTRFVISMTTLPKRLPHIGPVVESILKFNPDIDKLYICLPYGSVNKKHIPSDTDKLKVIRCKDYGPITKILGVLEYETDPDTLILTLDDDTLIRKNVTKILKKKAKLYPNAALSFSGWCYGTFPSRYQIVLDNGKDAKVDWIQGVHGILYHRKFIDLNEILQFELNHPLLFKNDDHRIAAYLESKHIDRVSINKNPVDYFKNYAPVSGIDAISGNSLSKSVKFWMNVTEVCDYLKKRGFYYRDYSHDCSIAFIVIVFLLLGILLILLGSGVLYYCEAFEWLYIGMVVLVVVIIIYFLINKYKQNKFVKIER